MSFSFNFLPEEERNDSSQDDTTSPLSIPPHRIENALISANMKTKPFRWLQNLKEKLRINVDKKPPFDKIALSDNNQKSARFHLVRVCENSVSTKYEGTDLVPGEYEGGGVVWECSLDLCRYFQQSDVQVKGKVLELGCGHGLPGCWVLRKAIIDDDKTTTVVFSDYNEFVLDATISNIVLNTCDLTHQDPNELIEWLKRRTLLGAGDWNEMSKCLKVGNRTNLPVAIPHDGKFDVILAAETTYSQDAANDTARLIVHHLKDGGIAYVATKRYYFGVGGGSDAFRDGIQQHSSRQDQLQVDTLQVYDNGAGNIRELIRVQRPTI